MRNAKYHPLPSLLCLPLGVLAALAGYHAILLPWRLDAALARTVAWRFPLHEAGIPELIHTFAWACGIGAGIFFAAGMAGLFRRGWALRAVRVAYAAAYVLAILYAYAIFKVTDVLRAGELEVDGRVWDNMAMWRVRWDYLWPALAAVLAVAVLHVTALRSFAVALYTGVRPVALTLGDRIVDNLRTHGRDPQYRKGLLASAAAHALVILLPLLLAFIGCVQNYRVPYGSGTPSVAKVQYVKPKKKKKKKKFILNPNAAIYFQIPDLDESDIEEQVEEETQLVYTADPNAVHGKMGAGGGKKGGWPEGVGNDPIRFIRLEYDGRYWDDGMDAISRADVNFLQELKRQTGFKVARKSESHPIRYLRKYDKGFAPPFVYMTGSDRINASSRDLEILREYLLDGGLLFADCGGGRWDSSFRAFCRALFPGKRLVIIADDDPLFQMPYAFPNGAPPLWHHGGMRALGIKHKGRWVVFYHPGDINDAWKTGHSGLDPRMARGAFQMGINIVYYSFTHYLEETRKYRK